MSWYQDSQQPPAEDDYIQYSSQYEPSQYSMQQHHQQYAASQQSQLGNTQYGDLQQLDSRPQYGMMQLPPLSASFPGVVTAVTAGPVRMGATAPSDPLYRPPPHRRTVQNVIDDHAEYNFPGAPVFSDAVEPSSADASNPPSAWARSIHVDDDDDGDAVEVVRETRKRSQVSDDEEVVSQQPAPKKQAPPSTPSTGHYNWTLEAYYQLTLHAKTSHTGGFLVTTKEGKGFKRDQYEIWAEALSEWVQEHEDENREITWEMCQSAFSRLKTRTKHVKWMVEGRTGTSFDYETGRVQYSDAHWEPFTKEFGSEGSWMKTGAYVLGNSDGYTLLMDIFAEEKATGSLVRSAQATVDNGGRDSQLSATQKKRGTQSTLTAAEKKAAKAEKARLRRAAKRAEQLKASDPDLQSDKDSDNDPEGEEGDGFEILSHTEATQPAKKVSVGQGSALIAKSISDAVKSISNARPVGAVDIQTAVSDFQSNFAKELSPEMVVDVSQKLNKEESVLWNAMEDKFKPVKLRRLVKAVREERRAERARERARGDESDY